MSRNTIIAIVVVALLALVTYLVVVRDRTTGTPEEGGTIEINLPTSTPGY